jgi:4-alpha-glucanotransferase
MGTGSISNLRSCVRDALRALDIRNLTVSIHDASFPSDADEDIGRGSPNSRGGRRFAEFVRALGFTGLQLGPDGQTPPGESSPYRGAAFPRNPLSIALAPLAEDAEWGGLLPGAALADAVADRAPGSREHAAHGHAARTHARALRLAFRAFAGRPRPALTSLADEQQRFELANVEWLERYELFEAMQEAHATGDVQRWGAPAGSGLDARLWRADGGGDAAAASARRLAIRAAHADTIAFFRFAQFVADRQRRTFTATAARCGLRLFGDLPIGLSAADEWCYPELFLDRYRMGAPPSRTTPAGQAWDYPVFDPRRYVEPCDGGTGAGPVLRFLEARLDRMFADVDGVRVDHPHGLVCPWVYDARAGDDAAAVRAGARLFESPALPDHPELAAFAIARSSQLNPDPRTPRYADDWVTDLDPAQVRSYGTLLDAIVATAHRHGRRTEDVVCEVLSTLPVPLARVLAAHDLGRFRVTQKAVLSDPHDVYRSENARPEDWVMVGTHDTRPIWVVVDEWQRRGQLGARAEYLAWRLAPSPTDREALARALVGDAGLLVHAQFADLFASPARNVMVFFADVFGMHEVYNVPGTVGPENWSLRVPPAYVAVQAERLRRDRALNLPLALAMALRARTARGDELAPELLRGLDRAASALRGGEGLGVA